MRAMWDDCAGSGDLSTEHKADCMDAGRTTFPSSPLRQQTFAPTRLLPNPGLAKAGSPNPGMCIRMHILNQLPGASDRGREILQPGGLWGLCRPGLQTGWQSWLAVCARAKPRGPWEPGFSPLQSRAHSNAHLPGGGYAGETLNPDPDP